MITDEYFANLAQRLSEETEAFILSILNRIQTDAEILIQDGDIDLDSEQRQLATMWESYNEEMREWTDKNLPLAYQKGLEGVTGETLTAGAFMSVPFFTQGDTARISSKAAEILSNVPDHHTMYSVFQQAAYDDFANTRIPVVRSSMDHIRELVVEASDEAYRQADTLTRRELSQRIMNRIADDGITGVTYSDGRTMKLDSYAEMVARSQTGNAARQAHINRMQEYGKDLIVVSQHYPVSPLCEPHQGKVYSLSGTSSRFPPFQSTQPGSQLYHANCKHSQSEYTGSIPEARDKVSKAENDKRYKAEQMQRYNERQIKSWKRREATAMTEDASKKAKAKVKEWQSRQRDHIDSNPFLRRKYAREQV